VEEYNQCLTQNTSLAKSSARTAITQTSHLFASLLTDIKLERLKFVQSLYHFALRTLRNMSKYGLYPKLETNN
jgi:hypothetical protein